MRFRDIVDDVAAADTAALERSLRENASAGATGAASVATVAGGIGCGFDPNGHDRSIYGKPKKANKPLVIRRG